MTATLSTDFRQAVERAAVRILHCADLGEGMGVLVPGGYVLTAAHCLSWEAHALLFGDSTWATLTTVDGGQVLADIAAIEGRADLAALRSVDGQKAYDLAEAYDAFVNAVGPVPVRAGKG